MQRVYVSIQFRKLLVIFIAAMMLLVLLSVLLVGIGGIKGSFAKGSKTDDNYSLNSENIQLKNNKADSKIKVYLSKENKIVEMDIEEYVRGVVAGEMPAEFDLEALKAQAVAARTYGLAHMEQFGGTKASSAKGADVDDTTNCQVYMSKEERMSQWDKRYAIKYWNKITDAVNQTSGQILTYDGKLVMSPYYFAISSGETENAAEVFANSAPYLRSVDSKGDKEVKSYQVTTKYTYAQLAKTINARYSGAGVTDNKLKNQISILERTTGAGSVKKIKLGNSVITGPQFREMLGLRSSNFTVKFNSKDVEITCKGFGHGVGMSQWGAATMAEEGCNYEQILTHYYQGVKIGKIEALE